MDARQSVDRLLGNLQASVSGLERFSREHTEADERHFGEIRTIVTDTNDRLAGIETIQTAVAKHEVQLAELEDAMKESVSRELRAEGAAKVIAEMAEKRAKSNTRIVSTIAVACSIITICIQKHWLGL